MARFRLRYLSHDLEIPLGDFFVGRSPDCQLSLDDPLVSRRHAVLHVAEEAVSVEDLGSRNGVLVNGDRIEGQKALQEGDKVKIGSQEMTLIRLVEAEKGRRPTGMLIHCARCHAVVSETDPVCRDCGAPLASVTAQLITCPACGTSVPLSSTKCPSCGQVMAGLAATLMPGPSDSGGRRGSAFLLLAGVAEKALALGRTDEAERILVGLFSDIKTQLEAGKAIDGGTLDDATRFALRLSSATSKATYVDWVFDAGRLSGRILAAPIVDDLYNLVRKIRYKTSPALRGYLEALKKKQDGLGPTDKFVLQRLDGLERLCAA